MKRATVIIGANFGDEGKGLLTDFHCSQASDARAGDTIVVRFNGGAQAGHTVVTPDGRRHVFHHFGSGSFTGATTYLSRFFIVNPLLWAKERTELSRFDGLPTALYVDPDAPLTTPYDMLINQEVERMRGDGRHGSCGVGINETITRNEMEEFALYVRDIERPGHLRHRLHDIRALYAPERIGAGLSDFARQMLRSDELLDNYMSAVDRFRQSVRMVDAETLGYYGWGHVVFEGAQGLLLDERHRFFPHVTRSRTGLANVVALASEMGIGGLNVTYVTRAYMTRHGAGPFPTEDASLWCEDNTNVPHEFQGALRFGLLDLDLLAESVSADLAEHRDAIEITPRLAITHLDQVGDVVGFRRDGCMWEASREDFITEAFGAVGVERGRLSYGPTRNDITTRFSWTPNAITEAS